jgi:hypothetical protein
MDATRGGPELEQLANDGTENPPFSASTANRNAVEEQSPAQPFLSKEKCPIERSTKFSCPNNTSTRIERTPRKAYDRSSHRAASDDFRKPRTCWPRNLSNQPALASSVAPSNSTTTAANLVTCKPAIPSRGDQNSPKTDDVSAKKQ